MKRIGIMSDTHGNHAVIDRILLEEERTNISLWLHAGDYGDDGKYLSARISVPVVTVRGNTDFREPYAPLEELVPFEDTFIYMAHGHMFSPYNALQDLLFFGRQYGAKLIVTGHTHRFTVIDEMEVLLLNPGSPARPRDGAVGTYALALYENGRFRVERREVTKGRLYL